MDLDADLFDAVINEDLNKARLCLQAGADPNRIFVEQGGVSPFHIAVGLEDDSRFTALFLAHGADPGLRSLEKDWTPVHVCAYWNKPDSLRQLLARRANPLQLDKDGKCALDIAAQHENRRCLDVLREFLARRQEESVSSRSGPRRPTIDQEDFSHFYSNSEVKSKRRSAAASPREPVYQSLDAASTSLSSSLSAGVRTSTFDETYREPSPPEHDYANVVAVEGRPPPVPATPPPPPQLRINVNELESVISSLIDLKMSQRQQQTPPMTTKTLSNRAASSSTSQSLTAVSLPRPKKPQAPPPPIVKQSQETQTKITNCRFRSPDRLPQFYKGPNESEPAASVWTPQKSSNASPANEKETQTSGRLVCMKASQLTPEPVVVRATTTTMARQSRQQNDERHAPSARSQSMDGGLNAAQRRHNRTTSGATAAAKDSRQINANIYNRFRSWMNRLNVPLLAAGERYPYPTPPETTTTTTIETKMPRRAAEPSAPNESLISQTAPVNSTMRGGKETSFSTAMNDLITDRIGKDFFNHVLGKDRPKTLPTPFKSTPKSSRVFSGPGSGGGGVVNFELETDDEERSEPVKAAPATVVGHDERPIVELSTREVVQSSRQDHAIVTTWAIHTNELGDLETTLIDRAEDLVFRETLISTDHSAVSFGDEAFKTADEGAFCGLLSEDDDPVYAATATPAASDRTLTPVKSADDELRAELMRLGVSNVGPVLPTTRSVLEKRLSALTAPPVPTKTTRRTRKTSTPAKPEPQSGGVCFSAELLEELADRLNLTAGSDVIESNMFTCFQEQREWREGHVKSAFNYLLIDPRVSRNLPARAKHMDAREVFQTFVRSVFYIGKGSRARPYAHLYDTLKLWKQQGNAATGGEVDQMEEPIIKSHKIQRIVDIWRADLGVVSLHCFQSVIPSEAYTREAAMIDAMGLASLTNAKRGNYYGEAKEWEPRRQRQLGTVLLRKACAIFLAEGERQIRPVDI